MQTTLDETIYRFETAHQSGDAPRITDFLPDGAERRSALTELIHIDLEYRLKEGESVRIEQYVTEFPEIAESSDELAELVIAEWRLRSRTEALDLPNFIDRFPELADVLHDQLSKPTSGTGSVIVRCPDCRTPLSVSEDAQLSNISCSSCGNDIRLVAESLSPGQKIAQFELIELVGTGAFGSVWKACDTELDRTVAIKVPRHKLDGTEADAFFREARATAGLRHPNIVTTYEVGRDGEHIYIASDFIEGRTLAEVLKDERFSPIEAARICLAISGALECAHAAGVVHRDLKPANIMVSPSGEPIVMDFGLAKRSASEVTMTIDGRILGTPAFMSPEQAAGNAHAADQRSDLYSLGVILFALLTNEVPFRGGVQMVLQQVREEEPPAPRSLEPRVPRDIETICLKCLEKSPDNRFATAAELGSELRRFIAGEPIQSRPISRLERATRWVRRKPVLAMLFSLLAAIGIAAPITAVNQTRLRWAAEESENKLGEAVADLREEIVKTGAAEAETKKLNGELQQSLKEAQAQFTHAHTAVYGARLQSARSGFSAGNYGRAITLLRGCSPAFREWEFGYTRALCERACRMVSLPPPTDVRFMRQGKLLVENFRTHVAVRDSSGVLLRKLRVNELSKPCIIAIAVVERMDLVICLDQIGLLTQWNVDTGERVRFFHIDGIDINQSVLSANGHGLTVHPKEPTIAVAMGKTGEIQLVHLETGAPVETGNSKLGNRYERKSGDCVSRLHYTPGGGWLLAFGLEGMSVYKPSWEYNDLRKIRLPESQNAIAFSPTDGTMFYQWKLCELAEDARGGSPRMRFELQREGPAESAEQKRQRYKESREKGTVNRVPQIPAFGEIVSVDFSPDGTYFAVAASQGELLIFETEDNSVLHRLAEPGRIKQVKWTSDSELLVRTQYKLIRWDVGRLTSGITAAPRTESLSMSVMHGSTMARRTRIDQGKLTFTSPEFPRPIIAEAPENAKYSTMLFVDNAKYLAVAPAYGHPRELTVFQPSTGRLLRTIPIDGVRNGVLGAIPNTSRVLTANKESVFVADVSTGEIVSSFPIPVEPSRPGAGLMINRLGAFPDGKTAWIHVSYRGLIVVDLATGKKLAEYKNREIYKVQCSAQGQLGLGLRTCLEIRDRDLKLVRKFGSDFERRVSSVCFSPNGHRIFGIGEQRILRVYDTATGANVLTEPIDHSGLLLPSHSLRWHGSSLVVSSGATDYYLEAAGMNFERLE